MLLLRSSWVWCLARGCLSSISWCAFYLVAWCQMTAKVWFLPPIAPSQQFTSQPLNACFPPLPDTLGRSLLLPSPHGRLGTSDFLNAIGKPPEAGWEGLPPPNHRCFRFLDQWTQDHWETSWEEKMSRDNWLVSKIIHPSDFIEGCPRLGYLCLKSEYTVFKKLILQEYFCV